MTEVLILARQRYWQATKVEAATARNVTARAQTGCSNVARLTPIQAACTIVHLQEGRLDRSHMERPAVPDPTMYRVALRPHMPGETPPAPRTADSALISTWTAR